MLTIFSMPKPFIGDIATIQKNAVRSWVLLRPRPEIILFGDEIGTENLCDELGLKQIRNIKKNKYGTPLLNDIFEKAHRLSSNRILCSLNTDTIIMRDFMAAAERVAKSASRFVMLGERWDFDLTQLIDYADLDWEAKLMARVKKYGTMHGCTGAEYFVFPKGIFENIPAFAVGRTYYDNWLMWKARSLSIPLIDATKVVTSIHQNHKRTYSSMAKNSVCGQNDLRESLEAKENFKLAANNFDRVFNLLDSTHVMTRDSIRPAYQFKYLKKRLDTLRVKGLALKTIVRLLRVIMNYISAPAPVPDGIMERYCKKHNIDLEYLLKEKKLIKCSRFGRPYYRFICGPEYKLMFLPKNSKKIIDLYRESCQLKNRISWFFRM